MLSISLVAEILNNSFPDELIDDLTLVGSKDRIKEKLEDWKKCNVTELSVAIPLDIETIKFIKSCL